MKKGKSQKNATDDKVDKNDSTDVGLDCDQLYIICNAYLHCHLTIIEDLRSIHKSHYSNSMKLNMLHKKMKLATDCLDTIKHIIDHKEEINRGEVVNSLLLFLSKDDLDVFKNVERKDIGNMGRKP